MLDSQDMGDQDASRSKIDCCILKGITQANQSIKALSGTPTIKAPKITIVMITEDFSFSQMQFLAPFLTGGLGTLIKNGINYTNATYPEGNPSTGPGHAVIGTGALGQIHGIPNNLWFSQGVEEFVADDYSVLSGQSLVYVANTSNGNPNGQTYPLSFTTTFGFGASNRNLLADTLADQVTMFSKPASRKQFYYVSNDGPFSSNSYLPAGQLGKAFAFDTTAGGYTSTQAFFPSAIVTITGGGGHSATATAVVVDGVITGIVVSNPGTGYTTAPTITITDVTTDRLVGVTGVPPVSPPPTPVTYNGLVIGIQGSGTGATATATVSGGQVTGITVTNGGSGYHGGLPDWVVNFNNAQNYPSMTSYVQNLTYPSNSPQYNLPNISNYSASIPSVIGVPQTITQSGVPLSRQNGTGATAFATVVGGVITAVTLTNGGSGYTSAPTVAISGLLSSKGVPATVTATEVGGVVTALTLVNGGSGYGTAPVVAITGNTLPSFGTTPFGGNFTLSPAAITTQFDFLLALIDNALPTTDELVIFHNIGVSVNEEVYGVFALDNVDSVYHLDQSFAAFIQEVYKRVDPSQVLFGWTSDEGTNGFMQYWQQAGYANISHNNAASWRTAINTAVSIATAGVITNLIPSTTYINITDIWFGPQYFAANAATQAIAITTAQNTLLTFPGVRSVYTQNQILTLPWQIPEEDQYLKLEYFSGRSGQLKFSMQPLNAPESSRTNFDYAVPLILYQPGQLQNKTIVEPVFINQLPITLAQILGVPRPSAAPRVWGPLPGIFTNSVTYQ